MKSTTIKPIENGSGVIRVLKFSMILINYEIETIDSETALCKVRHGRIIIDSKQYDFKIIDDDNNLLQFFLPLKISKGLSYSDIFNPYIEALVAIDDENTTIDPMIILEKLEKGLVTIVSLSKVKIPLRKLNRDYDLIWKKKKEKHTSDKFLLKVPYPSESIHDREYLFGDNLEMIKDGLYDVILEHIHDMRFSGSMVMIELKKGTGTISYKNDSIAFSAETSDVYINKAILPSVFKYKLNASPDDINMILPFIKAKAFVGSYDNINKRYIKINHIDRMNPKNIYFRVLLSSIIEFSNEDGNNMYCMDINPGAFINMEVNKEAYSELEKCVNMRQFIARNEFEDKIDKVRIYLSPTEFHRKLIEFFNNLRIAELSTSYIILSAFTYTSFPGLERYINNRIIDHLEIKTLELDNF